MTAGTTAEAGTARASVAVPAPAAPRKRRRSANRGDLGWAVLFLAPSAIGLAAFYIWPTIKTFYYSFTTWGLFGGEKFTGLANYRAVLHDPALRGAFENTFWFTLIGLAGLPVSLVLAALLAGRGRRGVTTYRVLMFLPAVTMPVAIAVIWRWLYDGQYGLINTLLAKVGITGPYWLSNPHTALIAIGLVAVWATIGYGVVIFMAALQTIPRTYYEAAQIDGAGPVRQFISVTVPMLSPTIFFMSVLSVIASLQSFDLVYMMIGTFSPALQQTQTVLFLFYSQAFQQNHQGYAAAIAFVLMAVIIVVTGLQFMLQKRWVH